MMGATNVPLELRPGAKVPIPCRCCNMAMIPFEVREGVHSLNCAQCKGVTRVEVYSSGVELKIRTASTCVESQPSSAGRS